MTLQDWQNKKRTKSKVSMLTCYDFTFASILEKTSVDCLLVGDSSSMVLFGHQNTINSTIDELAVMTKAVSKGAPSKFVVCDLPFGFLQMSEDTFASGIKKIASAGAHAVKIEGSIGHEEQIKKILQMGVPVMGHVGLTPQLVQLFGGFKVQGKNDKEKDFILDSAKLFQELGAFAVVLECIPSDLSQLLTLELQIPTVGIGAGSSTDGQVLVLHDFLGLTTFKPKFVKNYLDGKNLIAKAVQEYVTDIENNVFPSKQESYGS